ncbi:MAG: gliding motility-associated C-terminal domain-containing protein [Bacteroidales bacterium]|nr:gliding motility-associated C-terminal domain-containing protein [Bacteroidales bacterium]
MHQIFKYIISIIVVLLITINAFATHNRAGEITYEHISGNTYKITLITYTYTPSQANESRDVLTMQWGDDTSSDIQRISIEYLPEDIQKNTYTGTHTFPGVGTYVIVMSDPNRNEGIINIPESVTVVFTIRTILKIDPNIGYNNTPVMLNPPIDKAALNQIFIHNPNAYDPDGDSISYKLTVCLGDNGVPIPGYTYPIASNELYVDPITGDFVWNTPVQIGEYNVAIEIEEWRNGIKIGSIIRDMQIEVEETDNLPPVIQDLPDFCITAGDNINFNVIASDPDNDDIILSASGGPFEFTNSPATFPEITGSSPVTGTFNWNTICEHIRKQPYNVLFRAKDLNPEVGLTDYETANIEVVAPAPQNLIVSPESNSVLLTWDNYTCTNATGFRIYRKHSSFPYIPANCETGIPAASGYSLIAFVAGSNIISFNDNNNGIGLPQGYEYCYRITAFFEDGAESYVSNEACTELIKAAPIITETSVSYTHNQDGSIHITWMQPTEFDTGAFPGPYKYVLESNNTQIWENFSNPVEILGITDTSYIDTIINTKDFAKSYKVTLFSQNVSNWEQVGSPSYSSSLFLEGTPGDRRMTININDNTPWTNKEYVIYRKKSDNECNTNSLTYDSITTVSSAQYTDYNLKNDSSYWYLVKSIGEYDLSFIPKPLINYSQEICLTPQDTTPPCPVSLILESDCDLFQNYLTWAVDLSCSQDIDNFLIFYSDSIDSPFQLIDTVKDNTVRNYIHSPENSLGACYVVSAQDSAGNYIEPDKLIRICIDNCNYYELPNMFSPNADGINDLFIPYPYKFVEKIDMTIYNRWGSPVFETEDPDINWNGIDFKTKKPVSDGVYYYVCDVYEKRLSGIVVRNLAGFIRIFGNTGNTSKE